MASSEIPATAPSTTPSATSSALPTTTMNATTAESGAAASDNFVAMLTQLLSSTDVGLPVSPGVAATPLADRSDDTKTGDEAPADAALADALSAMLANAPPIVSQAIAHFVAERAQSGATSESGQVAFNGQAAANAVASQGIAMTGRMLADGATDIVRNTQSILQTVLTSDGKPNTADASAAQKDGVANPDGSNSASGINASTNMKTDQATPDVQLKERVGTGPWRDELGAKLTWMVERGVQTGSLRLSPEHLGPLEVRISVQNDQATVWFGAAHAETRASLEQALPRLRELFAASGLSLADAGVFREPPRENFKQGADPYASSRGNVEVVGGVATIGSRNGLLDAYA